MDADLIFKENYQTMNSRKGIFLNTNNLQFLEACYTVVNLHLDNGSHHLKRCLGKHTVSPKFRGNSNYSTFACYLMSFIWNKSIFLVKISEL